MCANVRECLRTSVNVGEYVSDLSECVWVCVDVRECVSVCGCV